MPQALSCDLLLYADDSCLVYQHKDVNEIAIVLNKKFSDLCDWFLDNKLSIHFGDDKTKCILFASKNKVKKAPPLNINYKDIEIKQHSKVNYFFFFFFFFLYWKLPQTRPGATKASGVIREERMIIMRKIIIKNVHRNEKLKSIIYIVKKI